jgi:hypothetical protein
MASAAATVPAESDLLCETCGYVLSGLPVGGRCPECGIATADSSPAHRGPPRWEQPGLAIASFWRTTAEVLFHPRRFYRNLATRTPRRKSREFAMIHNLLASLLFGVAAFVHACGFGYFGVAGVYAIIGPPVLDILILAAIGFLLLGITTPIAARLTSWEAKYRGYRLPLHVVGRGLDFHSAHYLPVSAVAAITVVGYRLLADHTRSAWISDMGYIYVLCGEVIVGAVYLFWTYWIGMRNMMYANA